MMQPGLMDLGLTDENFLEDDSSAAGDEAYNEAYFKKPDFVLEMETGERGANPESNKILDLEVEQIESKKNKCLEVLRNSTDIREMIQD